MLIGATFLPFLIFGYPAGILISKIGYKRTMATAFGTFAIASEHLSSRQMQRVFLCS